MTCKGKDMAAAGLPVEYERHMRDVEALKGLFHWPQPSDPNIVVEHRVAEGDAPEEILCLAEAIKCDLIVMGTNGRTGLRRFLTGSVAEEADRDEFDDEFIQQVKQARDAQRRLSDACKESLDQLDACLARLAATPAGRAKTPAGKNGKTSAS